MAVRRACRSAVEEYDEVRQKFRRFDGMMSTRAGIAQAALLHILPPAGAAEVP